MFIRTAFDFLELWSEARGLVEVEGDRIVDWRWLATRDDDEASFTSECALIH